MSNALTRLQEMATVLDKWDPKLSFIRHSLVLPLEPDPRAEPGIERYIEVGYEFRGDQEYWNIDVLLEAPLGVRKTVRPYATTHEGWMVPVIIEVLMQRISADDKQWRTQQALPEYITATLVVKVDKQAGLRLASEASIEPDEPAVLEYYLKEVLENFEGRDLGTDAPIKFFAVERHVSATALNLGADPESW